MFYDKNKVISVIHEAAVKFEKNLNNKDIMFLTKQGNSVRSYEIEFSSFHFKHFTGVKSNLSAVRFYSAAKSRKLTENDLFIQEPFLVQKKMNILESAMSLPYTAKMVGDFNYFGIKIQADIASGNNTFTMAFRNDENQSLYPVSVLEEDIRKSTKAASPIVVVLRKDKRAKEYDEITYVSKNINISNLHFPKEIKDILSDRAYGMLKPELSAEKTETKQKDLP